MFYIFGVKALLWNFLTEVRGEVLCIQIHLLPLTKGEIPLKQRKKGPWCNIPIAAGWFEEKTVPLQRRSYIYLFIHPWTPAWKKIKKNVSKEALHGKQGTAWKPSGINAFFKIS